MTIYSRTMDYCLQDLITPKQGIEMHFFPEQVVEILKKLAPPRQVTCKFPPPPPHPRAWNNDLKSSIVSEIFDNAKNHGKSF